MFVFVYTYVSVQPQPPCLKISILFAWSNIIQAALTVRAHNARVTI